MKRLALVLSFLLLSCVGAKNTIAPDSGLTCDKGCQDQLAVRALRETMKFVFNESVLGKPAGHFDVTVPCTKGGHARIFGDATPDGTLGSTKVTDTYVLDGCGFTMVNTQILGVSPPDPVQSFDVVSSGTIQESGTIAVQPTATTDLAFKGDGVAVSGKLFVPALDYAETNCKLDFVQKGNDVAGSLCARAITPFTYGGSGGGGGGFGGASTPSITDCTQPCKDAILLRVLRETMGAVYNKRFQEKPLDTIPSAAAPDAGSSGVCSTGTVDVYGTATSNGVQGVTNVDLTYVFTSCAYKPQHDDNPLQNYDITLDGSLHETGALSLQNTLTALVVTGDSVTITGTVGLPPFPILPPVTACKVDALQNGRQFAGSLCGRTAGLRL